MKLGCIADDFTGATDLANTLTRRGMHTVQTIGMEVVDTFYVRTNGALVTDPAHRREIQRALLHAVS